MKIQKALGYWAIGLMCFVATLVIIKWTIDFVAWSALDSGWAQVIGSMAALGVAIFVMSRQNTHAAKLIVDADTLAVRRRAAAVRAIFERAQHIVEIAEKRGRIPREEIANMDLHCREFSGSIKSMQIVLAKINAIPAHELGSYEIVDSLTMLEGNLVAFIMKLEKMVSSPSLVGLESSTEYIRKVADNVRTAYKNFQQGERSLK